MFTGIIQTTGVVRALRREAGGVHLVLDAAGLAGPIPDGASICVHGACLTVVRSESTLLHFDIVPETIRRSTLGALAVGDRVNLERSLRTGDPGILTSTVSTLEQYPEINGIYFFSSSDSIMLRRVNRCLPERFFRR